MSHDLCIQIQYLRVTTLNIALKLLHDLYLKQKWLSASKCCICITLTSQGRCSWSEQKSKTILKRELLAAFYRKSLGTQPRLSIYSNLLQHMRWFWRRSICKLTISFLICWTYFTQSYDYMYRRTVGQTSIILRLLIKKIYDKCVFYILYLVWDFYMNLIPL